MWDVDHYRRGLTDLDFSIEIEENRIGKELVDPTSKALQFSVGQAEVRRIGWLYVVAEKPRG